MSWFRRGAAVLVASAAALATALVSPGAADAALTGGPHADGTVVATFPAGSFPESLALVGGVPYVSLGFAGQVVRVTHGAATTVTTVDVGDTSLLTGVAVVGDRLYVARASFGGDQGELYSAPLTGGAPSLEATFDGSFPNGLALHDGLLYVSESLGGSVYTFDPASRQVQPWCQNAALAGGKDFGINGITFRRGTLYGVVAATGEIVTIAGGPGGCTVTPVVRSQQLVTGDGIAFGPDGLLYVAVNQTNKLVSVNLATGSVSTIAGRSQGLSYPTQMAFTRGALYLTNGAFSSGTPMLLRFPLD